MLILRLTCGWRLLISYGNSDAWENLVSAAISRTLPSHKSIFRLIFTPAGEDHSANETWRRPGDRSRKSAVETATAARLPLSATCPSPINAGSITIRLVVAIPQHSAYCPGRCPPEAFYLASISRGVGSAQVPSAFYAAHTDETLSTALLLTICD